MALVQHVIIKPWMPHQTACILPVPSTAAKASSPHNPPASPAAAPPAHPPPPSQTSPQTRARPPSTASQAARAACRRSGTSRRRKARTKAKAATRAARVLVQAVREVGAARVGREKVVVVRAVERWMRWGKGVVVCCWGWRRVSLESGWCRGLWQIGSPGLGGRGGWW